MSKSANMKKFISVHCMFTNRVHFLGPVFPEMPKEECVDCIQRCLQPHYLQESLLFSPLTACTHLDSVIKTSPYYSVNLIVYAGTKLLVPFLELFISQNFFFYGALLCVLLLQNPEVFFTRTFL